MSDGDHEVDEGRRGWGGAHVASQGPRIIVSLWGEHDLCTAATVVAALSRAVDAGAGDVVVDVADVSFLDASTLGLITCAHGTLRHQARSLSLRSPSRFTARLLEVCDLAWLIEAPTWAGGAPHGDPHSASLAQSSFARPAGDTRSFDERGHGR